MHQEIDLKIYLIGSMEEGLKPIEEALAAGVSLFQLREKNLSSRRYLEYAKEVRACTRYYEVPLIINDRLDIALLSGADGVHLGQSDLPIQEVRVLTGEDFIIGATAKTLQTAQEAEQQGANYIGVGAWFQTTTKQDATQLDYRVYEEIKKHVNLPSVAIGGITLENCHIPLAYGVDGLAMANGILKSESIKETVKALKRKMEA